MNGVGALFWKMYAEMDCHGEMETQRMFQFWKYIETNCPVNSMIE